VVITRQEVPISPRPVNLTRNAKKPANLFAPKFQRKRPKNQSDWPVFAFIRSNLCTRHSQKKLTRAGITIGRINALSFEVPAPSLERIGGYSYRASVRPCSQLSL
jgi:hypothetical protein